jgi:hypothetical protein
MQGRKNSPVFLETCHATVNPGLGKDYVDPLFGKLVAVDVKKCRWKVLLLLRLICSMETEPKQLLYWICGG